MFARTEHFHSEASVIDRAAGEDDRVDIVSGEQLRVGAMSNSKPPPYLLGAPLAGRRDRHQLDPRQPLGILGVEGAHPAETGDAEPKRRRRP
jgi:hypothetical protein